MLEFTICEPSGPPVSHRFDADVVSFGRAPDCDLVVRDPKVSRHHAEVRRSAEGFVLRDHKSHNGTLLNGRRVSGDEKLTSGDRIQLGRVVILFDLAPPAPRRPVSETQSGELDLGVLLARPGKSPELVGTSAALRRTLASLDRVARSAASVLLTGENGTGKELAARRIHALSPRAAGPFVVVNCPALHGALLEPELFGVEKGVATGVEARRGKLELAHRGTLLLDEIGDLDAAAQAKLLRFLQEHTVERIGGRQTIHVDVRVVAATHHDLEADVQAGTFRRDLYHRLKTVHIVLPPLRERREDIPLLVERFLAADDGPRVRMSPEALALLEAHAFPGNVRELEQIVRGALALVEGNVIRLEDLPDDVRGTSNAASAPGGDTADRLYQRVVVDAQPFWDVVATPYLRRAVSREQVRQVIRRAHAEAGGSYKEMARLLRVSHEYKKLVNFLSYHRLGVDAEDS